MDWVFGFRVQKMGIFSDVQFCIYPDLRGGWVRKSPKFAYVIYDWALRETEQKIVPQGR